jgi:hypothetical protein
MNKIPYESPEFKRTSFNCPICNAYANQSWFDVYYHDNGWSSVKDEVKVCFCGHCDNFSLWKDEKMISPDFSIVEPPNQDLSEDVIEDYEEAASILQKSPRGAAALLRLSIQKLCKDLGGTGQNINEDIKNLVATGLPVKIQQSLDIVRVIGNESVHPGQIDLRDDMEIAKSLFKIVNFIAEKMVTEPKEINEIYEKIPDDKKKQIEKRDNKL